MRKLAEKEIILLKMTVKILLLLSLFYVALSWLNSPDTLPIKQVRIEGNHQHISKKELTASIAAMVNTGYFAVNKTAVLDKLNELPWVRTSHVRTVWPDTLVLTVSEHNAYAYWNDKALISEAGVIFSPSPMPTIELAKLEGSEQKSGYVLDQLKQINQLLSTQKLALVKLSVAEHGAWQATLSNGIRLKIGHQQPAKTVTKGLLSLASLDQAVLEHIQAIDLRYPNGISVKWKMDRAPKLTAVKRLQPAKG